MKYSAADNQTQIKSKRQQKPPKPNHPNPPQRGTGGSKQLLRLISHNYIITPTHTHTLPSRRVQLCHLHTPSEGQTGSWAGPEQ